MKLPISAAVLVWAIQLGVNIVSGNKDMGEEAIETDRRINSKRAQMSHVAKDSSFTGVDTNEVKLKPRLEPGHVDENIELREDEDERDEPICGVPNRDNPSRIFGGSEVTGHKYPWMVALKIFRNRDIPKLCGGSLISNLWFLTAAHCMDDCKLLEAYIGTLRLDRIGPDVTVLQIAVSSIMVHPDYQEDADPFFDKNDIALVKLPRPVAFTPICLPQHGDAINKFFYYGENVQVLGWGATSHDNANPNLVLNEATQTIVPDTMCRCHVLDSQFCLGNDEDQGTSYGDSGGPAQAIGCDGRYVLRGVLSNLSSCLLDSVAIQVAHYLRWISEVTGIYIS